MPVKDQTLMTDPPLALAKNSPRAALTFGLVCVSPGERKALTVL